MENNERPADSPQKEWDQKLAITSRTERLILYFSAVVLLASIYIAWSIQNEKLLELLVSLAAAMAVAMLSRFLIGAAHIEGSILGLKITGVTQGFAIFILAFVAFYFLIKPSETINVNEDGKTWIEIRNPGKDVWDVSHDDFYWYNALFVHAKNKFDSVHYRNIYKRGMNYNLLLFAPLNESVDTLIFRTRFDNMREFLNKMNKRADRDKFGMFSDHLKVKVASVNSLPSFSFFRAEKEGLHPYIVLYVDKVFNSVDDTPNHMLILKDYIYEYRFKEVFNEDWSSYANNTVELDVKKLLNQNLILKKWTDWKNFLK